MKTDIFILNTSRVITNLGFSLVCALEIVKQISLIIFLIRKKNMLYIINSKFEVFSYKNKTL